MRESLFDLNRRGLIQAPQESEADFFGRCRAEIFSKHSSPLAKQLFDIDPDWIEITYENKGLRFWEGGCTWINGDQVTLQLQKVFLNRETYLGYEREEIIAHEYVHVVRGGFNEPIFEEILAYQTSSSPFRRFFGPLFRSSRESLFFMLMLTLFLGATLFGIYQLQTFIGVCSLMLGGTLRLIRAQRIFVRARKKISHSVGRERALAVLMRLTDKEIIHFSKINTEEMQLYAQKMSESSLRWQQISSYFSS